MSVLWVFGATSSIAQATTEKFVKSGHDVVLIGRDGDKLKQLEDHFRTLGASYADSFATELTNIKKPDELVSNITKETKAPDIVLFAQGSLPDQKECEQSFQSTFDALDVNLISLVALLASISNIFEERQSGSIIAISSVAGDRGRQSNYVYGTAKGALTTFLSGLRNRLNPFGVQVLTVKPGFVDTPMTAHLDKGGLLWAKPEKIANDIYVGYQKNRTVIYTPFFWWPILMVIKSIPESIFKKLKL